MQNSDEMINRIEELETKIMFQDESIEQLNQSIIQQQKEIKMLIQLVEKNNAQLQDIRQPNLLDAHLETPPPHY